MNKLNSEMSISLYYYFIILACLISTIAHAQTTKIPSVKVNHDQPLNWIPFNWIGDKVSGRYFDKLAITIPVTLDKKTVFE